jgi:hypothetical protein
MTVSTFKLHVQVVSLIGLVALDLTLPGVNVINFFVRNLEIFVKHTEVFILGKQTLD